MCDISRAHLFPAGAGGWQHNAFNRKFTHSLPKVFSVQFIVDLRNCPVMDSTFMGTLVGVSLRLRELGEGCLYVRNLNERNSESVCSLGLDRLFDVRVSATKEDGQALRIPLKEYRTARAQTMLEAHEALIKAVPENLPEFKDIIQYLKEELHLPK